MKRGRFALVLIAGTLVAAALPSAAGAKIGIYESSEEATLLGEVRSGKCKVRRTNSGKIFHARAVTTNNAYRLVVFFVDFRGFGREYNIQYGKINPSVDVEGIGNGADFSTVYPFPGTPPDSAGQVLFSNDGRRMGVGAYAVPNSDYTEGVAVAGNMRCRRWR